MMRIPRFDPRVEDARQADAIRDAVDRVISSGCFIGGSEVDSLEHELGERLDSNVVCVGSGTDAITMGLMGLHAGKSTGGLVVTTALSFAATASAILRAGLRPLFVDVDPGTLLMDWDAAARVCHARAVLPVHLYGRVCVAPHGWSGAPILEDACQAFGARGATRVGEAAALSFFPSKPLGCYGDGGALVCSDEVARKVRMLARHGTSTRRYVSDVAGFNSRLDAIQAAILRAKLPFVDEKREKRDAIAEHYEQQLADVEWLKLPERTKGHAWHCYVVRVRGRSRESLLAYLLGIGIEAFVPYPVPLHKMAAFSEFSPGRLQHAELACSEVVGLPIWSGMSEGDISLVTESLRAF